MPVLQESEKANSSYSSLLKLSRGVATEYVLHKYGIAEPSIVALVAQPAKLICKLYENYGVRDLVANSSAAGMFLLKLALVIKLYCVLVWTSLLSTIELMANISNNI